MRVLRSTAVAVLLTVSVVGCGGPSGPTPAEKAAASKSAQAEADAKARAAEAAKKKAEQSAVYKECSDATAPLDAALSDLNSRLNVGLPFADYSAKVGDVRVAYDAVVKIVQGPGLSEDCLNDVATVQENAVNRYTEAYTIWNDCTQDYDCSFDEGSDALKRAQDKWAKATALIEKAEAGLQALQPA